MRRKIKRNVSLFMATVMIATLAISATVFADTIEDVPVLDANDLYDSGEVDGEGQRILLPRQVGTCTVYYELPAQPLEFNLPIIHDDGTRESGDPDPDISMEVTGLSKNATYGTLTKSTRNGITDAVLDLALSYNEPEGIGGKDPTDYQHVDDLGNRLGFAVIGDNALSLVLTIILNNAVEGLPNTLSAGIHDYWLGVSPHATIAMNGITADGWLLDNNETVFIAGEGCEEDTPVVVNTSSAPEASASPAAAALSVAKDKIRAAAASLKTMDAATLAAAKNVGLDLDFRQVSVLDAETVTLLQQNNSIPYNIVFEFQGQAMVVKIPAGFDFSKYKKADGTILLTDIIWAILSKQLKLG